MDRLTALQVFHRVAQRGSFAEAGRSLGLSPAAISKNIAELEAHVGTRLIQRTTRRMVLTEEAACISSMSRGLWMRWPMPTRRYALQDRASGLLKVSAPMTVTLTRSHAIPAFCSATPGCSWTCTWTTGVSTSCAKASIWPSAAATGSRTPR
jgi:DNA-binding transcriptional LysR family regulator